MNNFLMLQNHSTIIKFEKDNKQTSVTAFAKTLSSFLDEDVYQYKDNEEALTEKLLLLENVDFHFSITGRQYF